ncbi:hypothetical protein LTR37_001077 [Vermiconidia calcicola]|uniref:Uncharacterized protein n=1 Tax=Vermiconidia calcicola TaxID=1690605 RepID=A0ACC3NY17_9PEZI|nr:hypothetical protein LTR37_001077 [Vermiconidia calcicola]
MAKLKFEDLSADIKALVVDRIIRPTDLKNVCLVNKQLHEIAVKPLYRNVALDLGSSNDNRLSAFLSPKNIGLKHVKQVRLYLAKVRDRCNQEQQAQLVSKMILEFLPEDILEEFRCGDTDTYDEPQRSRYGGFADVFSVQLVPMASFLGG